MASAVKDDTFNSEVLQSSGLVLVDFWAEWCGPCKALGPILDDLSSEMSDTVKILKLNIEDAPETPSKYGIRGVPTMILFKDGQIVDTRVGGLPKDQLKAWIEKNA